MHENTHMESVGVFLSGQVGTVLVLAVRHSVKAFERFISWLAPVWVLERRQAREALRRMEMDTAAASARTGTGEWTRWDDETVGAPWVSPDAVRVIRRANERRAVAAWRG